MKLIRIACRLLLIGTGTGKLSLYSASMNLNSLNDEMRDKYSQLYCVRPSR